MQRPSLQGRAAAAVHAWVSCRAEENHHQERPNLDIPPQLSLEEELPSGGALLLWMPSCCGQCSSYTWGFLSARACVGNHLWLPLHVCRLRLHHQACIAPL